MKNNHLHVVEFVNIHELNRYLSEIPEEYVYNIIIQPDFFGVIERVGAETKKRLVESNSNIQKDNIV